MRAIRSAAWSDKSLASRPCDRRMTSDPHPIAGAAFTSPVPPGTGGVKMSVEYLM
ncbi:hypothetical protein SAMN02745244_02539 [Tessaracoccus bendigoensis DSM 12906]|uniref:Uncharacterized protein n=1 Tax=Tessaracoccus bendigoensis DSM 12906 TaxID=1123357 RepID=A0A1M6JE32_9ACTN|nr:hypothetical protein SAMN02745244_02539 [Tessaracoccus bendigoensis DSM 12906]